MVTSGLSPRVRGSHCIELAWNIRKGSIPACAGEPRVSVQLEQVSRVYPRVCGGARTTRPRRCSKPGLSPRVRGSQDNPTEALLEAGSIPACAGEPGAASVFGSVVRVYPRVCGGAVSPCMMLLLNEGLSPRVRGSHASPSGSTVRERSIPACAGEPRCVGRPASMWRVYPRVCGGARSGRQHLPRHQGLSPRVRGSHDRHAPRARSPGSIPACAGEPAISQPSATEARVYPRVCGGALQPVAITDADTGLSPRVRGSPPRTGRRRRGIGSIPACAGEPMIQARCKRSRRVYPRVCGGALYEDTNVWLDEGLSPRVRGSQSPGGRLGRIRRSIPACAGEPSGRTGRRSGSRVYPRVCGGAGGVHDAMAMFEGLSPRVRGSLAVNGTEVVAIGSIPACAGEPPWFRSRRCFPRVYPRVCGGASYFRNDAISSEGLSPRVRGSLRPHHAEIRQHGSIPACAGEPMVRENSTASVKVYPRVCGGALHDPDEMARVEGLSPRVRGSPP